VGRPQRILSGVRVNGRWMPKKFYLLNTGASPLSSYCSIWCPADGLVVNHCRTIRAAPNIKRDKAVFLIGWTQFQRQVVEQWLFVDCNDNLAVMLLREGSQKCGELSYMNLIHALDRIIDN
jgi:hypothetical protein